MVKIQYVHNVDPHGMPTTHKLLADGRSEYAVKPISERILDYKGRKLLVARHRSSNEPTKGNPRVWEWELIVGLIQGDYLGGEPTGVGLPTSQVELIPVEMRQELSDFVRAQIRDVGKNIRFRES